MTKGYIIKSDFFKLINLGNRNGNRNKINEYTTHPMKCRGDSDLYPWFKKMHIRLN